MWFVLTASKVLTPTMLWVGRSRVGDTLGTGLGDRVGDTLGTGLRPYLEASRVGDPLGT